MLIELFIGEAFHLNGRIHRLPRPLLELLLRGLLRLKADGVGVIALFGRALRQRKNVGPDFEDPFKFVAVHTLRQAKSLLGDSLRGVV